MSGGLIRRHPQTPAEWAAKRAYWCAQKRRLRSAVLAQANQGARRCRFRLGPDATCDGWLREVIDRMGVVRVTCERCARRNAGVCQDCPCPVEGRVRWALRCAPCKRVAQLAHNRRWVERHRERKNASVRAWRRKQAQRRAA